MMWTRVRDWLIGALGMLVVLGVAVGVLWWAASSPAGAGGGAPAVADSGPPPREEPQAEPPSGLGEDEVWLADLELDAGTVVAAGSTLRDVRAVGQGVVTGPTGLVAERLTVDATVPFDAVAAELGGGAVVRPADDGQVTVVRTVQALGRDLPVTATGTVDVEDGRLVMEPRSIDLGGPGFLSDGIAAIVRRFVTIEHEIEGLPEGLVLRDVAVQGDGFRANLTGEGVALAP
ncbi:LmeA family phospholipid-binding protein [Arthrobacter sp. SX1312]|uniref:LmeA family phospholipid-binding protein n=1 Tax=Arthrobacter sp. SX1312 TaxID=2058896 RepID=UPI000CE49D16|nr:LmeA family phospholipid-binding protein [Arthrobacter sp. SX1312]